MSPAVRWMKPLRDAIGRFLSADDTDAVFAQALAIHGRPLEERDLSRFVDQALDEALKPKLDPVMRRAIVRGAHSITSGALHDTAIPRSGEIEVPEADTLPRGASCSSFVLIAARSKSMERGLRLAEPNFSGRTVKDIVALHAVVLAHAPGLWIIDATDPPPLAADELRRAYDRLPGPAVALVWAPARPYGLAVLQGLRGVEPAPMLLGESEPDALLDLVRALREEPASAPPPPDEIDPYEVPTDPWR